MNSEHSFKLSDINGQFFVADQIFSEGKLFRGKVVLFNISLLLLS